MQNFILEKFFPSSVDDNIRQLHGIAEFDLTKTTDKQYKGKHKTVIEELTKNQQNQYPSQDSEKKKKCVLFPVNLKEKIKERHRPMLRFIDEYFLREDYLKNYNRQEQNNLKQSDKLFAEVLKTPFLE